MLRGEEARLINKLRETLARGAYVLYIVIICVSVLGIGYSIIRMDREKHLSQVKHEVEQALFQASDQIRMRFFEAVLVASNIQNLLGPEGEIPANRVARVVKDLQKHIPGVIAVGLAPGLEITHSFPETASKSAVGLKYWQVPEQLASVAKSYRRRSPVADGPVPLIQGGQGYILRYPVFLQRPDSEGEYFWGMISIVVQADGLLTAQQHDFGDPGKYEFSLREYDAASMVEPARPQNFTRPDHAPVVTEFTMMGNTWRAAARPVGGWPAYSPQSPYLLGFGTLSALLLVGGFLALRHLAIKKENAHTLLSEAIDCINEGFLAFDERERLVIVNQKYIDYHKALEEHIVPGQKMETLLRLGLAHYRYPDAEGREEEWVAERLRRFRNPGEPFVQYVEGDRYLKVTEAKTPHGYTVGIRTDVTAEKHAQEAAEAADREKTEFLNNVSHELRTPLTVISGRASFLRNAEKLPQSRRLLTLLEEMQDVSPEMRAAMENYQRFVSEQGAGIADSAQHMLRLVEDLLDWTKVARGQLELDMAPLQADEVAQSVVHDLQPDAAAKGLALTCTVDASVEAVADKIRLKQILYNLISNAIKFTQEGSIQLAMETFEDRILFSVTDTGCGISEADQQRVFQRFQQVDGSMSRQNGGLGLGLAIAEQLADLHGGSLSLESKVGVGSTFRFSLPREKVVCPLQKSA